MRFSYNLVALRRERRMSQEALADLLGISRQSVAKWEAGESLPEIEKLIALGDMFQVSVDALLRDEDACAAVGAVVPASNRGVIDFLRRAKQATYAASGSETTASRIGSHDLCYREGDLLYYDTYLGGARFSGEEALWRDSEPIWAMNYTGRTLDERFSGDFLKEALRAVPEDIPFRGPRFFQNGRYSYHCAVQGGFEWFDGREEILYEGVKVYECLFHGGTVA